MEYSRRDLAKITIGAALPAAFAAPTSKFNGVEIGVITYSFRGMTGLEEILAAIRQLGIGEVELMSNTAEAAAGAPAPFRPQRPAQGGAPSGPPTPEQRAAMRARMNSPEAQKARDDLRNWRRTVSLDKFKPVRQKFDDAGIDLRLLCFNMNQGITDEEIEYAFQMAKALGAKAITTSTQVSVSKRVAPFADKHKLMVGYHGHDNTSDPNEFSTPESFATAMSYSKYNGVNLDIGHFTSANYDPVAYIKEHHSRITNLHLKDKKRDHGDYTPWGQGDTPIKEVLQLMKKQRYSFPANIEYEYRGESDPVIEVGKCLQYCKQALA